MFEGNTMLAGLAARTSTIALGLLVAGVGYRNPAQHAKITTTLDVSPAAARSTASARAGFEAEHQRLRVRVPAAEGALRAPRGPPADRAAMFTEEQERRSRAPTTRSRAPTTTPSRCAATSRSSSAAAASARRCGWSPSTPTAATCSATPSVRGICSGCSGSTARTSRRDPAGITKTSMRSIAIAETEAGAGARSTPAAMGFPEQRSRACGRRGTPEQILERAHAFRDVGIEGLTFSMGDVHDLDAVALAGDDARAGVRAVARDRRRGTGEAGGRAGRAPRVGGRRRHAARRALHVRAARRGDDRQRRRPQAEAHHRAAPAGQHRREPAGRAARRPLRRRLGGALVGARRRHGRASWRPAPSPTCAPPPSRPSSGRYAQYREQPPARRARGDRRRALVGLERGLRRGAQAGV